MTSCSPIFVDYFGEQSFIREKARKLRKSVKVLVVETV